MNKFDKIIRDIKEVKIQGATNVAKAGLKAYQLDNSKKAREKIIKARPTEPLLFNSLKFLDEGMSYEKILNDYEKSQEKINKLVLKLMKGVKIVYTHCHSSTVERALIYAKKKGERFQVYNTETRPLFQGRKTARELRKAGIKVTMFIDSGMKQAVDKADVAFIGADAILKKGVVNKIGSNMLGELMSDSKTPLYVLANSWKFFPKKIKIEERDFEEVWKKAPKKLKIKNPAFELVEPKYIRGIVSELGVLKFREFVKKADNVI